MDFEDYNFNLQLEIQNFQVFVHLANFLGVCIQYFPIPYLFQSILKFQKIE